MVLKNCARACLQVFFLIEDCCQAMGSRLKGEPVGAIGDVSFFSFNRGKTCLQITAAVLLHAPAH